MTATIVSTDKPFPSGAYHITIYCPPIEFQVCSLAVPPGCETTGIVEWPHKLDEMSPQYRIGCTIAERFEFVMLD